MRIVDVPVVSTVIATLAHVIAYTAHLSASEHFQNGLAVVYIQEVKCASLLQLDLIAGRICNNFLVDCALFDKSMKLGKGVDL